ncbi:hypothetical protein F4804DRAFT_353100 [Jackrogersella minutella]|nr:hypothetical protein F4804DRAFT_353100 [Jackrogersella minutella]
MKSFVQALLFTTATCATIRSRQGNDGCCFQLASVGKVNETVLEDHVGDLLLGGTFQQGGFCLDKTSKTIKDGLKHNCFMRGPDYQFECYQGAVGDTAFDVTSPKADGKSYLTYDNGPGTFYACPIGMGADQTYDIYSSEKTDKDGCLPVALALVGETDACSANSTRNAVVTPRSKAVLPNQLLQRHAPSPVCNVSSSAPSLAPYSVSPTKSTAKKGDTSAMVRIYTDSSTTFDYRIPQDFTKSSLCALEFRMPVCFQLPDGYPCYGFTGMEQEVAGRSGMALHLTSDDANAPWNNKKLHQVFPDATSIIGTFECGQGVGPKDGARMMSWNVSSVRQFGLDFLQAGVGPDAEFQDGIGFWIVPCQ